MAAGTPYVGVALDLPVDRLFTYRVPEHLREKVGVGTRVRVSFRNVRVVGLVAELQPECDLASVLDVEAAPDEGPLLPGDLVRLGSWIARYYGCAVGEALAAMVPRGVRTRDRGATRRRAALARPAEEAVAHADALPPQRNAQARCLRLLARHPEGCVTVDVERRAKVSSSPLETLAREGWIRITEEEAAADPLLDAARSPVPADATDAKPPDLNDAQRTAVDAVSAAIAKGEYASFLLLGVTGSGKTEVYLRAIEACRAAGKQAVVLVPEIALTPQTVRRFRARVPAGVAVLHSAMSEGDRAAAWRAIRAGEAEVVIGPRSAVFAPVPRLGLLVLDEEHETSFKQQNVPRYHARDAGLVRAKEAGAVVILGSATPSLESYRNALEGRHRLLELPDRVEGLALPPVRIVDLRRDGESRGAGRRLSRTLHGRLAEVLAAGEQAILFLNRRGYSTSVSCPRCGWCMECPHCDVSLVYHRHGAVALCHLCGHEDRAATVCPDCAFPGLDHHGAGTQTVEEELRASFPGVSLARMDSDTMTTREDYEEVLGRFARKEVSILLGTQMIAKGLHFPSVTLVGVVSADTSLSLPDFRAAERTFALVAQVAGRAGRGGLGGDVVVQTLQPDEPAVRLAAAHAYREFATLELADREAHGYPPYRRLLRVVVRGKAVEAVTAHADELARRLENARIEGVEWLGPAIPPIARMQGFFRRHLLVKATTPAGIRRALDALRGVGRSSGGPARGRGGGVNDANGAKGVKGVKGAKGRSSSVEEQFDVDPVGLL